MTCYRNGEEKINEKINEEINEICEENIVGRKTRRSIIYRTVKNVKNHVIMYVIEEKCQLEKW